MKLEPRWLVLSMLVFAAGAGLVTAQSPRGSRNTSTQRTHGAAIEGLDCGNCHTPEGWGAIGGSAGRGGFDHDRTGFHLSGRHASLGCADCHRAGRTVARECATCHRDPHRGELGRSCDRCHSARAWSDTAAFDAHRLTRLPLTGMHALADCTQCHQRTTERTWTTPPAECFDCHARQYLDPAVHPIHRGTATSPPFPRDCAQCHRTIGWSPAVIAPSALPTAPAARAARGSTIAHDARFVISRGAHRGADCSSCHASEATPRMVRCTGCHAHAPTTLRAQHRTPVPTDGASCLGCHPGGLAR
ncbi:MAG: hypothetical protein H5U40_04055 [Polyangiaceae bacterium]|nr:hypothetical protein [Polyangiaceae bacterium]